MCIFLDSEISGLYIIDTVTISLTSTWSSSESYTLFVLLVILFGILIFLSKTMHLALKCHIMALVFVLTGIPFHLHDVDQYGNRICLKEVVSLPCLRICVVRSSATARLWLKS